MSVAVTRRWEMHCPPVTIRSKAAIGLVPRFLQRLEVLADPFLRKNEPILSSLLHASIHSNPRLEGLSVTPTQNAIDGWGPRHPTGMICLDRDDE
jgi:hypothetical protein